MVSLQPPSEFGRSAFRLITNSPTPAHTQPTHNSPHNQLQGRLLPPCGPQCHCWPTFVEILTLSLIRMSRQENVKSFVKGFRRHIFSLGFRWCDKFAKIMEYELQLFNHIDGTMISPSSSLRGPLLGSSSCIQFIFA